MSATGEYSVWNAYELLDEPGEFYFNFGYPGVLIGMLLLGIWFRLLQEHFFGPDATIPALVLACFIIDQTAKTVGGGLTGPINGAVLSLIPIACIHLLLQALVPPSQHPRLAHR